jgi:hypothetical protein
MSTATTNQHQVRRTGRQASYKNESSGQARVDQQMTHELGSSSALWTT